ncbi:ligase-associated DNA damage response endonuclease PdeM [Limnobacter humi]|uniref:Ligase-associated DNA damage response endonuclease PdeM n=1 Tax=Limnobacter humi TaxID=1778671 RepID=A0ABT1WD01_9BURK|nr:ligase-associated DNA damage response endonuclease PdeM [Limnobacter humi]MCQ8895259.1 ligase-associated DNA damage response endonuclease PdeM [Limnobacter humi]
MQVLSATQRTLSISTPAGDVVLSRLRSVYVPAYQALLVADVHLGKAATFRSLGVPVPAGTTSGNLQNLSEAVAQFNPQHVYILGDLFHAKAALNPALLAEFQQWRSAHATLELHLIVGNHDSKAGMPPAMLNIQLHAEPHALGGFALCHHPQAAAGSFSIAGHVHPVCRIQGKGRDTARLPCFVQTANSLLMPAFGEFTGGHVVQVTPGQQLVVVV